MREVNTHKIIRIFLASSIDDTKEERDKLQNKILAVWNPIFNKFNIELKIFRCEQMTEEWLKRNQKTIDDEIRNSDVFIVIFKNTVGNYTFHEFEVARDCYSKTNGKPRIYPYISNELIKNIDKIPALQEITRDDNYPETFIVGFPIQYTYTLPPFKITVDKSGEKTCAGKAIRLLNQAKCPAWSLNPQWEKLQVLL